MTTKPKRRWQFSLAWLLVASLVVCIGAATGVILSQMFTIPRHVWIGAGAVVAGAVIGCLAGRTRYVFIGYAIGSFVGLVFIVAWVLLGGPD